MSEEASEPATRMPIPFLAAHAAADVRMQVLERQMSLLCSVLATEIGLLGHYLAEEGEDEEDAQPTMSVLDGGTRACIDASLIATLGRIDALVADESRWKPFQSLDDMAIKEAQVKLHAVEVVANAAEQQQRPSARIATSLVELSPDKWICVVQGTEQPGSLFGVGANPAEALADFDNRFLGALQTADVAPTQQEEKAAQPQQVQKPAKKKTVKSRK